MRLTLKSREAETKSGPRPNGQLRSIFELWLALATRPNEVLALRPADIAFDDAGTPIAVTISGTITTDEHGRRWRQPMGKTDSALRMLPLVPVAAKAIQRRLDALAPEHAPGALLFTQRDGVTPHDLGYLTRAINLIAKRAGIDGVHAYLLRRTSATAIAESFGLEAAAMTLGHTDGDVSTVRRHYVAPAARLVSAEIMGAVAAKLLPDID
jgi:integrase